MPRERSEGESSTHLAKDQDQIATEEETDQLHRAVSSTGDQIEVTLFMNCSDVTSLTARYAMRLSLLRCVPVSTGWMTLNLMSDFLALFCFHVITYGLDSKQKVWGVF